MLVSLRADAGVPLKVDHILVIKKKHELQLLSGNEIVKTYSVALGGGGLSPKRREGDRKTPEGNYRIDFRNSASMFHLALHISYPNEADKEHARKLGERPGSDIMIHGLGKDFAWMGAVHRRYDWTDGCIAVTDEEIDEIWRLVPDGTPVTIRP
jgi:murein L,D-transpeptidase YafK